MNALAADLILLIHAGFVLFVVLSLPLIIAGKLLDWRWVHNFRFRTVHLISIGIVTLQAWLGMICPLTTLEMALRERAGDATYPGSFIAYWVSQLIYYDLPLWVFAVSYSGFCGLVVICWFWVHPRK
ncbi:MAG: DUF2784 domain-containing protein [Gammaproteobacteria bacterium]